MIIFLSKKCIKCMLLMDEFACYQEAMFDFEIKNKKGSKNSVADHLSRLHIPSTGDISDTFLDKYLLII